MTFLPSLSVVSSVYKGEAYLLDFFKNLRDQTIFPELEIILVLNEPTNTEKQIANDFLQHLPDQVSVIYSKSRESLGSSWNRAWKASRSPYLAFWNVDDRRVEDSLQRQLNALEENPNWVLCYGDYIAVPAYLAVEGARRYTPNYRAAQFKRSFAQGGAFWVLRKNVSNTLNYFDEQFSIAPDMEFSFRIATNGLEMGKAQGLLGYFTDAASGLSTRDGAQLSEIERTVIQLRYGVFDKVNRRLLKETGKYMIDKIKIANSWIDVNKILPGLAAERRRKKPLWIVGFLRSWYRAALSRLGLLDYLHEAQDRYLRREI